MEDAPTSREGSSARIEWGATDWACVGGLVIVVCLCWAWVYGRFDPASWSIPIAYKGDGLSTLSVVKLYAQGEFLPFGSKTASALNAPAVAYWNDYPSTEEIAFALSGLLARLFGLYAGTNLSLLVAHVLCGVSFFVTARLRGARSVFAFVGALAFAMSPFLMRHSVQHLMLVHSWHVPPLVLITFWVVSERGLPNRSSRHVASLVVAGMVGAMNPYFSAMFLQFLVLAAVLWCVRGEFGRARVPLQLMLCVVLGFVAASADTFAFAWVHGWNGDAVARNLADLERLALRPVELILPRAHRLAPLMVPSYWGSGARLPGAGAAYLGWVGIGGLLLVGGVSLRRVATRDVAGVPAHTWLILWMLAFSIVGGINMLLGLIGFQLLRATDRYAFFILAVVLLFLVEWLTAVCPRRAALPVAAALAALVVWDQVLPDPAVAEVAEQNQRLVESDRAMVEEVEDLLGPDAMVFQLPATPFPEARGVRRMPAYESLRPFLNATSLRFSFGAQKGRGWEQWQRNLTQLPTARLVVRLEALGFDGLLIHRAGFGDRAKTLLSELARLGKRTRIESRAGDLVFVRLKPSAQPERVVVLPLRGFQPLRVAQGRQSLWSAGRSELILHSLEPGPKRICLDLELASPQDRRLEVSRGERVLLKVDLIAGVRSRAVEVCLDLDPGPNTLQLSSGEEMDETLAFRLIDLRVRQSGFF